jgi:uncharacterized membrane protein YraQ (UPF0718 family)
VDNYLYDRVKDFLLVFRGILFEAMPWVVIGAAFAGLVQELPNRRAPAVMLALGLAILILTMSPLPLLPSIGIAAAAALVAAGLMLLAQRHVDSVMSFLGHNRPVAIAMSGLLGLVNPMCDCGVMVIMRRFLRKGMPLSCCVAYILAGPIVNVLVIATTFQAFNGQEKITSIDPRTGQTLFQMGSFWMIGFRVSMGYLVAVVTAFVVEAQYKKYGYKLLSPSLKLPTEPVANGAEEAEDNRTIWQRIGGFSEAALHDFTPVAVLLIIGSLVTALIRQVITPQLIESLSHQFPSLAILFMMTLAFLITICSEADAFVAAGLTVRPAARLAFLVFGPMLDLKLFFMYTRVFRPRLMWTIIFLIFIQVFAYSLIVHFFWETYSPHFMSVPAAPIPTPN